MTYGVHIQVSTMTMAQGASATLPSISNDDGGMPVKKLTK